VRYCIDIALEFDVSVAITATTITGIGSHLDGAESTEAKVVMGLSNHLLFIEPSLVHIAFFHVIDQIGNVLQSCNCEMLAKKCSKLKASDVHCISFFTNKQIERLKEINDDVSLFLRMLSSIYSWCDHSILRTLVGFSDKATSLLDEFDSRLDPLCPIASYPIPCFSLNMIPNDKSSHTILAVRCEQKLYKLTLQCVYDMTSLLIEKLEITQYCLQLLAVRGNPTILVWTIPKCIVDLISKQVPQHGEYLYSKGILEMVVYPKLLLTTGDDISVGSLVFSIEKDYDEEVNMYVTLHLKEVHNYNHIRI